MAIPWNPAANKLPCPDNPNHTIAKFQFMMNTNLIRFAAATLLTLLSPLIAAQDSGSCLVWTEGDAQHLVRCEASSLEKCAKGKKAITKNEVAFDNYKGRLFRAADGAEVSEFRNEPPSNCRKEFIQVARGVEATMASQWGAAVYSAQLKVGDKAYVYGKSVTLREEASTKSKALGMLVDRAEVKVFDKSKQTSKVANLFDAYWFKIMVDGSTGWVYGQFLHPDPNSQTSFVGGG